MQKDGVMTLNGTWQLRDAGGKYLCPVGVPGSVLSGMREHGLLEDPYYRMNEYAARELLRQDFSFCRKFTVSKEAGSLYELCCDGIDTAAGLFLNGVQIGNVDNMHRRYRFPVTDVLRDGENELEVRFESAIRYVEEYVPQPGKEIHFINTGSIDRNQYIRKAHCMFGWDWGPQLPDMGIFREIRLCKVYPVELSDVYIRQEHGDGKVGLTAAIRWRSPDGSEHSYDEKAPGLPGMEVRLTLTTPDGETLPFTGGQCLVKEPKLWWPNRYGGQPLYTVNAQLYLDGILTDEKEYRIGLRTLTVSRRKDEWGEEFAFCVNGVRIFAKGADYIPEAAILSDITAEKIHGLLRTAADCGFNCIRSWGGGYYPTDDFYDFCDENGLVVWQDFMFACNIYELTDEFRENIVAEVKDNVRRLKHHASLGLWCGNNELETAWENWDGFKNHPDALRRDYLEIFEKIIPEALRTEDDTTFYWPSSPSSGGGFVEPDGDDRGDRHYWDVWHGEKPFTDYEKYFFRFCSEFGFQSFPCMKTIESFTRPQDRNIFSEVMESHQKNGTANGKILHYISEKFLYPKDLPSLVYISQILQGIAIKSGVEHWRRNRGRCMGAVYWQFNDNWPVASWSSVDYFGRWKALQYMARHFYADMLGSLRCEADYVYVPCVQNETRSASTSGVVLAVKDMHGTVLAQKRQEIACEALSTAEAEASSFAEAIRGREGDVFVEAVFSHWDGTESQQLVMPKPYKHMNIPKATVQYRACVEDGVLHLYLKTDVPAFFVSVESEEDFVLSDNFFHLTTTEERHITAVLPESCQGIPAVTIRSLCDSWEMPQN